VKQIVIVPGLVVDDDMFDRAASALALKAPELPLLTWGQFTDDGNWFLVPDPDGFGYKGEYVALRTADHTVKINRWMGPDLRSGQQPMPHNHPWVEFTANILAGGYTEDRYEVVGGEVRRNIASHRESDTNVIARDTYHEVVDIDKRTLTIMDCGLGVKGDWGYIDPRTGLYIPNTDVADPTFMDRAKALNPRLR
jgi:hypothetical protein